jgi:hypothetical protein
MKTGSWHPCQRVDPLVTQFIFHEFVEVLRGEQRHDR